MVKVMIDTNIIISFLLRPQGQAAKALHKASRFPYMPVICGYIADEVRDKFRGKLSAYSGSLPVFEKALPMFHMVPVPEQKANDDAVLRDLKDMPILRAAIGSCVDLLLTGDKDFLESGIESPRIVSVAEFLAM